MNTWIRRSVGVVVLSAGLVAAGASVASAATPATYYPFPVVQQQAGNQMGSQSNNVSSSATGGSFFLPASSTTGGGNFQSNFAQQTATNNAFGSAFTLPLAFPY